MDDGQEQSRDDERPDLRVGDAERSAALRALDTHMEAGRLSVDEYGDRSAAASVATVRSELAALFGDLPAPHPPLPERAGAEAPLLPATRSSARPSPAPALAFGAVTMLVLFVPMVAVVLGGPGVPVGGLVLLPLVFLLVGGLGRPGGLGRRGPGHHGPGGVGPGHDGPHRFGRGPHGPGRDGLPPT